MKLLAIVMALFGCALAAPPDDGSCGVPAIPPSEGNTLRDGRIVGGKEAVPNSWPWMIQVRNKNTNQHSCGASLISNNWILSAAHCFNPVLKNTYLFRAGGHIKNATNEPYQQTSGADDIILHEQYSGLDYDVAVIRLTTPFTFTRQVSPVCLPTSSTELNDGELVHITGFGVTEGTCCANALKQVRVPIVSRDRCNGRDYYRGRITERMICAGVDEGGLDSCQNDSGGPLVIKKNDKWYQYGVVSWGEGCADPMKPGVYSNVAGLQAWIRSKVTQVERERKLVARKFRPVPIGSAFR